jgi:hypothetical protein
MKRQLHRFGVIIFCLSLATPSYAQGTQADYERSNALREKYTGLAINLPERAIWIGQTSRFWYRKAVKGGNEFVLVDAETMAKRPAFDHAKIAASLSTATGEKYEALKLPFQSISFVDSESAIDVTVTSSLYRCGLSDSVCRRTGAAPQGPFGGRRGGGPAAPYPSYAEAEESPTEYGNDVEDGMVYLSPQQGQGGQGRGGFTFPGAPSGPNFKASPDNKWEAVIQNYNVFLRPKGKAETTPLSWDGSEGSYYTFQSIAWSPDSKYLTAYRVRPGYRREVHYIESSPTDQLQPKHSTRNPAMRSMSRSPRFSSSIRRNRSRSKTVSFPTRIVCQILSGVKTAAPFRLNTTNAAISSIASSRSKRQAASRAPSSLKRVEHSSIIAL